MDVVMDAASASAGMGDAPKVDENSFQQLLTQSGTLVKQGEEMMLTGTEQKGMQGVFYFCNSCQSVGHVSGRVWEASTRSGWQLRRVAFEEGQVRTHARCARAFSFVTSAWRTESSSMPCSVSSVNCSKLYSI